jgi:hypothetical protein
MTPAEPRREPLQATADPPAQTDPPAAMADSPSEQPVPSEQDARDALLQHYRAWDCARRERRRRQLRIAVGTLVVAASLLTAGLFWTRHQHSRSRPGPSSRPR